MDLRVRMIQEYSEGHSISALAEMYAVSRKTIYKWLERHDGEGVAGLADRHRAPHDSPNKVSAKMVDLIIAARHRWRWGPYKLRIKLVEQNPQLTVPAASTIGEVLKRAGLTHRRKLRVRTPAYAQPFATVAGANQTGCADFKGWFRTGDGTRCDPLTITDAHSRYLLRCQITPKADTIHVTAIFDAAFRQHGLPLVIHTDNGVPFASTAPGGLSRLSMHWIRLGILPERSRVASPQDNGRHERMHLTLKQATLRPPERTPRKQQEAFDRFQHEYNHERPHAALDDATPASLYSCSPREMPRRIPELMYDEGIQVRRISQQGSLKWKGQRTFVSEVFAYEWIGLSPLNERLFEVRYGPLTVGYFDGYSHHFHRSLSGKQRQQLENKTA
jgi:putative transposase